MIHRVTPAALPASVRRERAVVTAIVSSDPRLLADVFKWGRDLVNKQFVSAHAFEWSLVPGWRGRGSLYEDDKCLDRWLQDETERRRRWPDFVWCHTPLSFACLFGRLKMVRVLVKVHGADATQEVVGRLPEAYCLNSNEYVLGVRRGRRRVVACRT